jgi:anti-anti-sigma factor
MGTPATARAFRGRADHTSVLALMGEIRYRVARGLRQVIDSLMAERGCDTALVDLRELVLIDSTGMGLLARLGRATLEQYGRRAIIVCADEDIVTCLRAAAFDTLFVLVEKYPFDPEPGLDEVVLDSKADPGGRVMGRLVLDAHRDLASLSDGNRRVFGAVVDALESELGPVR